ncbi:MAG: hypothetical protein U0930_18810 [Pirellulales bacterium]
MLRISGLVILSLALLLGCNKGPSLIDVPGTVKIDGTATDGVNLIFFPEKGGNPSSAVSENGGKFKVVTDMNPGLPAGNYSVTATYPDPAVKPTDSQRMQGLFEPGPDLLKGKYQSKDKGVKIEVSSSTKELTIELKK